MADWKLILVSMHIPVPVTFPLSPLMGHMVSDSSNGRLHDALPECFGRTQHHPAVPMTYKNDLYHSIAQRTMTDIRIPRQLQKQLPAHILPFKSYSMVSYNVRALGKSVHHEMRSSSDAPVFQNLVTLVGKPKCPTRQNPLLSGQMQAESSNGMCQGRTHTDFISPLLLLLIPFFFSN